MTSLLSNAVPTHMNVNTENSKLKDRKPGSKTDQLWHAIFYNSNLVYLKHGTSSCRGWQNKKLRSKDGLGRGQKWKWTPDTSIVGQMHITRRIIIRHYLGNCCNGYHIAVASINSPWIAYTTNGSLIMCPKIIVHRTKAPTLYHFSLYSVR